MSVPAEYISQQLMPAIRRQAWTVWLVALAIASAWCLMIVAAPLAQSAGITGLSTSLYRFFSFICHQIPERSFHVAGEQFGVCSRCFGVYFGIVAGIAAYPVWRSIDNVEPIARFWLFLALVPAAVDWSLTIFGIWENTQASRFITGLILGAACATFIVPAAVEIARNFTFKRRRWSSAA